MGYLLYVVFLLISKFIVFFVYGGDNIVNFFFYRLLICIYNWRIFEWWFLKEGWRMDLMEFLFGLVRIVLLVVKVFWRIFGRRVFWRRFFVRRFFVSKRLIFF